jgi:23S rRNA (uracil1939-C5)-methyltransferase
MPWGYRHRARLSVRHVPSKGVLVGFHERRSSFVADMTSCLVLPARISALLPLLRDLIASLSIRDRVPQIELAIGEGAEGTGNEGAVDALVLRVLEPPSESDARTLAEFGLRHVVQLYLQPGGPNTARPIDAQSLALRYRLPDYGVSFEFAPTDFTQVNASLNRVLVRRAISLLDPKPGERIADFFCGLGNFTLPIAKCGADAIGIEGNRGLVEKARANAACNGLADRVQFSVADLFEATATSLAAQGPFDKALLDPPREGAIALVKVLPDDGLRRMVYVSCNPATLARDAAVLVHQRGFSLRAAGVANMFPHTTHVESVALFTRP